MNAPINKDRLKAAAEHLEWVLQQYPKSEEVQGLLEALRPLIAAAKEGRIHDAIDSGAVPGAYNFADGVYIPYKAPSVDEAYTQFRIELRGGLTDEDRRQLVEMEAYRSQLLARGGHV